MMSSPREVPQWQNCFTRSASIQVAQAFLDEYLKTHPDDSIEELDLWNNELAPFG